MQPCIQITLYLKRFIYQRKMLIFYRSSAKKKGSEHAAFLLLTPALSAGS